MAYLSSILENSTLEIFLAVFWNIPNLVETIEIVFLVMELKFSRDLLIKSTHHCVKEFVSWCITRNHLTIVKLYLFMSSCIHCN